MARYSVKEHLHLDLPGRSAVTEPGSFVADDGHIGGAALFTVVRFSANFSKGIGYGPTATPTRGYASGSGADARNLSIGSGRRSTHSLG